MALDTASLLPKAVNDSPGNNFSKRTDTSRASKAVIAMPENTSRTFLTDKLNLAIGTAEHEYPYANANTESVTVGKQSGA